MKTGRVPACSLRRAALLMGSLLLWPACAPSLRAPPPEPKAPSADPRQPLEALTPVTSSEPVRAARPAQEAYWQGRTDLLDLPAAPAAANWTWPEEASFSLPNGLVARLLRKPDESLVTAVLTLPAGEDAEPADARGAAAVLAGWLRGGTLRRDGTPLDVRVEELGASLSIEADRSDLAITCTTMQPMFSGCLRLMADLAEAPALPQQALLPVRAQLVNHSRQRFASAQGLAQAHLANLVFGDDHPAGRPILPDDLGSVEEAKVRAFWARWFRPASARLVVAGNLTRADLQRSVSQIFGPWSRQAASKPARAPAPPEPALRVVLVDDPNASAAHVMFGQHIKSPSPQDRAALEALVFVFGGAGTGSRLALDVATQGLINAGGAALEQGPRDLVLRGTLQAPAGKAWQALLAAAQQLKDLAEQGLSPAELAEAKARSAALDPFGLETGAGLATAVARHPDKSLRPLVALSQHIEQLNATRLKAAGKLLRPAQLSVVIVGPAKQIEPNLQRARVRFERVGFDDPISADERAARDRTAGAGGRGADFNAKTMIIKALAAQGGAPAWRALSTLKVVKQGQRREPSGIAKVVSTTYYRRPDTVRVEQVATMGGNSAQGVFVVTPQSVRGAEGNKPLQALPQQNVERLRDAVFEDVTFVLLNILDAKPSLAMQLAPPLHEGAVVFQGALVRLPSGPWLKLYFDPDTHLLARILSPDGAGGESEQRLSDWREIDGLKFPFTQRSVGVNASEATLQSVQVNPPLAEDLFH